MTMFVNSCLLKECYELLIWKEIHSLLWQQCIIHFSVCICQITA
jgi:hypothetical protein